MLRYLHTSSQKTKAVTSAGGQVSGTITVEHLRAD